MDNEIAPRGTDDGCTAPKTRKRKLTEDRRRQNREAQRRYRDRRKSARDPVLDDNDVPDVGVFLDGANDFATPPFTSFSFHSNFTDCLLPPIDSTSIFGSPFFENMLLLDSSSTAQESTSSNPSPPSTLPSPYKNHLTVQKLSFYAARTQNALYLGLPLFLAQQEDHGSPWHWHTQFALLVSQETILDITGASEPSNSPYKFSEQRPIRRQPCWYMSDTIIPDLSPTLLQKSHAHGMYLDMIPFPIFRDRAITLLSMNPPALDEQELKRDIENEGLMVWGAGHGSTSRVQSLVRDKRNWECSRWFYKKWKLLLDGSGLDEQSQWWRTMRGEEESDEE